jgi:hypothetical protein
MELEQVISEQEVRYRPKKRDSAGRDEQQARAMDLPPRSGSKALYPGSKEQIALGGNAPQPVPISQVDEAYAEAIAEALAEYPRALYHKAFKRERDAAGKVIPGGEVFPLPTADAISPNYPIPANVAQRAGIKGILSTSEGSPAIIGQHLYRTCLVPAGWQPGDKLDLAACKKEEAALLASGWKRSPAELDLPKPQTIEQESDE